MSRIHTWPLQNLVKSQPNISVSPPLDIFYPTLPKITYAHTKDWGETDDLSVYTTGGTAPDFSNNRLYMATVVARSLSGGAISAVSISGGNMTWVKIAEVQFKTIAAPNSCVAVFRAMVASGATDTDVTWTWSTTAITGIITIAEFDNVITGGTDGDTAIIQVKTMISDSTPGPQVVMDPFSGVQNAAFGAFSNGETSPRTFAPGFQFTATSAPTSTMIAEYQLLPDTTINCTQSGSTFVGGIGIEIGAAP